MVRPVAPTLASEEPEFTPLEDILRPVSATMVEPLDLPDDRFVPLEDILYAAGSAFARPSPELEEYYATARKREAEAETEEGVEPPTMPDSVTKPDDITPPKPEGVGNLADMENDFPQKSSGNFAVPESRLQYVNQEFDSIREAARHAAQDIQQLTQSDAQDGLVEYGTVIRARLDPATGQKRYFYSYINKGAGSSAPLRGGADGVAAIHSHPPARDSMRPWKTEMSDETEARLNRLNLELSPADQGVVRKGLEGATQNSTLLDGPFRSYLINPNGELREFQSDWSGPGTIVPETDGGNSAKPFRIKYSRHQ